MYFIHHSHIQKKMQIHCVSFLSSVDVQICHIHRFCYSVCVSSPLCPSLTSLPLLISPISAPLSSALFAVTFHAVIWAETVCLTLAQDLSFHGNFIIVLDTFQAPLDTEALLMSKETCMKWGDVEASIWFRTQPHAKPFNRSSMGVLWYRWIDPTWVTWYFIILDFSTLQRDNGHATQATELCYTIPY